MRVLRKTVSLVMILAIVLTMFPLGSKTALADTASGFRTIIPAQQWFFESPNAVAVDNSGNMYVGTYASDENPYQVTKLSPTGEILDSWGTYGSANGRIDELADIAVDGDGNVYVADSGNKRVQKFSLTEEGYYDYEMNLVSNGDGDSPMSPSGVAVDSDGNIYVTYEEDNQVVKFNSLGQVVNDNWSNQDGSGYQFSGPTDIAVVDDGSVYNVYVVDNSGREIVKFSSTGAVQRVFGTECAYIKDQLIGVTVDSTGSVYAVDAVTKNIQKFNGENGWNVFAFGGEGCGYEPFDYPCGIAVDSEGYIYVTDSVSMRVQKFDSFGHLQEKWGRGGSAEGEFYGPYGIAMDTAENIYVSDTENNRIQKFDATGAFVTAWGNGSDEDQLNMPMGIAVDSAGNVYVADTGNNRIQKFNSTGEYLDTIESSETSDFNLNVPMGLAVDDSDNLYVTELGNNWVQKFSPSGSSLGTLGGPGPVIGECAPGEFRAPGSVAIDSSGNIYVLDTNNHRVQKFSEFSTESFVLEWGNDENNENGGSEDGQLSYPNGIAVDRAGNVYISDSGNNRVQKFSSTGEFIEAWGSPGFSEGEFHMPASVMVDNNNSIYVVDSGNNRIQKLGATAPTRYTVTFDSNGGSSVTAISNVAAHTTVNLPTAPTKAGYTFAGWYTDNGVFANGFTASTPVTGNITVYAKWAAAPAVSGFIPIIPNEQWFFDIPTNAAVDSNGNIYIVNSNQHQIKKLSPAGEILATWGGYGPENGQLYIPCGIALDSEDNVYIADSGNNRIQKFSSTGEYMMKFGSRGSGNGQFSIPKSVAVDSAGNIYVADTGNNRIQKFNSDGEFIRVWGEGQGTGNYQFNLLYDIAVGDNGNIYAVDSNNSRIQVFTANGGYVGTLGGPDSPGGPLNHPRGVTVDQDGNIYVADTLNYQIQKFNVEGEFLTKWGSQGVGNIQFGSPYSVATDSSGNVYVVDTGNSRIQKFASSGSFLKKWGSSGSDAGEFNLPYGIATDSDGNIYVVDKENHRIQKFDSAGTLVTTWGSYGSDIGQFKSPKGIAVDSDGNVYVADSGNDRIQKFDSMGENPEAFGSTGIEEGFFKEPSGVAVDSDGNIYVVEAQNHRMQKFDSSFQPQYVWGGIIAGTGDDQFNSPEGVAVDSSGNIYVLDTSNNRVLKFDPDGHLVLKWGSQGSGDSQFMLPCGIDVDNVGNVYVADTYPALIKKFSSTGTFLAKWGTRGKGAGQFNNPSGIAVGGDGTIYVADTDNNRIQKLAATYTVTFDSNGGSSVAPITNITKNATVTLPSVPTKSGYTFAGWYTDNTTFTHAFTGSTPVTGNVMVYAKWTAVPSDDEEDDDPNIPTTPTTPTPTTVTGNVKDGDTGSTVSNITATVTKDSNNQLSITMPAAQIVIVKQPGGMTTPLVDVSKVAITDEKGTPLTVSADGTLQVSGLAQGTDHHYTISYDFGNGQKINIGTMEIKIDGAGNVVDLSATLIDPYGVLTDKTTGEVIAGAKITLYYADTARNKAAGKIPGTLVELPILEGFSPNDNKNPQISDAYGAYAFMVFPTTDYCLVVTKEGYDEYKSPTISVEQDIVKWDIQMKKSTPTVPTTPTIEGMNRLAGLTQVDTALEIAKATFPGKLSRVVLATADQYPDALAGSVLAYQLDAPILLVGSTASEQQKVLDYLKSNLDKGGEVYILGGTAVVSADMEAKIKASGFNRITRIGGFDRYETALKIAEYLNVKMGTPIVLAYGESYQDALSISSMAAKMGSPIFLVPKEGLSQVMKEAIAKIMPSQVYLIGGTAVISAAVEAQVTQLMALDKTKVVRIAGYDGYETSLAVAKYFNGAGESESICIATGNNFPDALAGSVYAAKYNAPIVLVDNSRLSAGLTEYLKSLKPTGMTLFGGEAVVSNGLEKQLRSLIGQ